MVGGERMVRSGGVRGAVVVAVMVALLSACSGGGSGGGSAGAPATTAPAAYPNDATLKLNQIQMLGTHNSYHQRTPQQFRDKLEATIPGISKSWNYGFEPLDKQLDMGVRQME